MNKIEHIMWIFVFQFHISLSHVTLACYSISGFMKNLIPKQYCQTAVTSYYPRPS